MALITESDLLDRLMATVDGDGASSAAAGSHLAGSSERKRQAAYEEARAVVSLDEAMADRRTVRSFADAPVPVSLAETVVRTAVAAESHQWRGDADGSSGPVIYAYARRVTGMSPGLHAWRDSFEPAGPPALSARLADIVPAAPFVLLICGDLRRACDRYGPHGYGHLLVRAGTLGHAAWLAAVSLGLAGFASGAVCEPITDALRKAGAGAGRHLLTVGLGRAHEADH